MTAQSPQPSLHPNVYAPSGPAVPPPPVAMGQYYEDDLDVGQLLDILRRRWIVIGGVALAVSGAIWSWTLTRTPIFQSQFRVLIASVEEVDPSQELLRDGNLGSLETVDYDTQIEVLRSPALLEPIVRAVQGQYPEFTYTELATNLAINRLRDTKVLAVSYRHPDAQMVQDVLREVADQYLDYSFEQRQTNLQQGIQFVDDQLPEIRERVKTLQVQLEKFRQQYSILDPETRGSELSSLIATVEAQRQDLQAELSEAQSLFQTLQGQLETTPEEALSDAALSESTRYQALLNQIQELEAEIAVESSRYQPNSPQILALEERRDNLAPLLDEESARILGDRLGTSDSSAYLSSTALTLNRELIQAANNVQMLQARNRTLARIEGEIKEEFDLVPGLARQYTDLQRDLAIATDKLNRFLTTRETLQIDAAQSSIPWQLIAPPTLPGSPISPNIPRNLILGAMAGLLLGAGAALMTEKLDQVFHSADDLKQSVPFPLLGTVPYLAELREQTILLQSTQATGSLNGAASNGGAFASHTGHSHSHSMEPMLVESSMFLESFRSMYTNIKFLETETSIRSLVISSSVPGEGKTTNAIYLAKAAAAMGQRVLLVDADLRAPKHHTYLGLPNIRGLSNSISDQLDVMSAIQTPSTDANFSVLTAGPKPPDPVKLLASQRMKGIVAELESHFDLVVYDMPPLIGFADSSVLAAQTDGMVIVVGLGVTERTTLSQALDEIKMSTIPILGIVANSIKAYTTPRHSADYYHYYGSNRPRRRSSKTAAPKRRTFDTRTKSNQDAAVLEVNEARQHPIPHSVPEVAVSPPAAATRPSSPPSSYANGNEDASYADAANAYASSPDQYSDQYMYVEPEDYGDPKAGAYDNDIHRNEHPGENPPIAVVDSALPSLFGLRLWQLGIVGSTVLALSAALGWVVYDQFKETSPSPSSPPPTMTAADDPFSEAVRIAQSAVDQSNTASTAQDWSKISQLWFDAAARMDEVAEADDRYDQARDRTVTYRKNAEYARQQALKLQIQPNTP